MRWVLMLCAVFSTAAFAAQDEAPVTGKSRSFEFTYTAKIETVPEGAKSVDLWVPLPQSSTHQEISNLDVQAPSPADIATEPTFNNKMAHWKIPADKAKDFVATIKFDCKRFEVAAKDLDKARDLTAEEKEKYAMWLKPNRLVLVGGAFDEVAMLATKGANGPNAIAKAGYDYTVSTMKYDKPKDKPGWGNGSTTWACDSKFGNCTDFHAMIMSIGRTRGLPVKFEMGFPLPAKDAAKPETSAGPIGGYHCWADYYLGGLGWVPVDASEAQKHPELTAYYYGNLTVDRVKFTEGRDVNLVPKQAGDPLNYFIYPYAEADGKAFPVTKSFAFKDK